MEHGIIGIVKSVSERYEYLQTRLQINFSFLCGRKYISRYIMRFICGERIFSTATYNFFIVQQYLNLKKIYMEILLRTEKSLLFLIYIILN